MTRHYYESARLQIRGLRAYYHEVLTKVCVVCVRVHLIQSWSEPPPPKKRFMVVLEHGSRELAASHAVRFIYILI